MVTTKISGSVWGEFIDDKANPTLQDVGGLTLKEALCFLREITRPRNWCETNVLRKETEIRLIYAKGDVLNTKQIREMIRGKK